ncbi:hypothetical protein H1215_18660 [Anoxybacillus sp. LAT_38]|uniref:hypothetical protein n=1 Tax=Anoxybacillus sp. LAT_26 TaxID=2862719 RepID=UPI001EEBC437|nr:hypothetical protein [Anoxybacillus sp. LAT_26]MCG6183295.1 hypothetical protein [Anoxybacillus sp. LAT_26]MCG6199188.1 hypothetical protein [Anoxybacillus sp. LAT_38]
MTREEKKRLRMQIIKLLDECDGCKYKTDRQAVTTVCKRCSIGKRLLKLGEKFKRRKVVARTLWNEEEERFLVENYDKMTYQNIANRLGRTRRAIKAKVEKMRRAGLIPTKV